MALLLAEFLDRCGDVAFVEVDDDAYLFYGRLDRFSITKIFFPDGVAKKCVDAKSGHTLERARTCSKIVKTINTSSLSAPNG